MTDEIKHECGIAFIRLRKPLEYYQLKYGTWRYGINKLYLLMEKQHNRGQDGAGIACVKLGIKPGHEYLDRRRSVQSSAINDIFQDLKKSFTEAEKKSPGIIKDIPWAKYNLPFAGEVLLGHLRYGTYGKNNIENAHPVLRQNNWKSRTLVLAGNFNLTNVEEMFQHLVDLGQHPRGMIDTVTILENVGHFLDVENQREFNKYKKQNYSNREISTQIENNINISNILRDSSKKWDGGYVISGMIGHGDAFVMRDPWGIRPAFYYYDDEIVVAASERPVIQTVMNLPTESVLELDPGKALVVKKDGSVSLDKVREPKVKRACSFERIYFSRGSDKDIYQERKKLGAQLTERIVKGVNGELENTVFSFIPNTAETAFYGMVDGIQTYMQTQAKQRFLECGSTISEQQIDKIISLKPRIEKVAIKDIKLRTFISQDEGREDLVGHVYDITYKTIKKGEDNLVVIDDSIVRGTTLKNSIIRILDRLGPKRIIIVSSSPQIRYPDCYGIDMAKLGDFIAFRAAIELLKENGKQDIINDVYKKSKNQQDLPKEQIVNYVKEIYEPFTQEEISAKISEMLKTKNIKSEVKVVFQTVEGLHKACPDHTGDWYFTGDYPTPGGNKVVNTSFINFIEGKNIRAY
ncbi:MAG: amidophosphoribosyltransferase [Bacteroidales bacterium]|nr:amidophosphoribosyltransferase [Bacteroidales bacterium]